MTEGQRQRQGGQARAAAIMAVIDDGGPDCDRGRG